MKRKTYLDFIQELLADDEEFCAFKNTYQQRIQKSIKPIISRIEKSDFFSFLEKQSWNFSAPNLSFGAQKYDDVLFVDKEDKTTLGKHFLHQGGFFYVQEISAGLSAQILALKKGDIVLDLCAAPGGKTIQLADKLLKLGGGNVLANELSNPRRKALIFNLNRCGMLNTAVTAYDGKQIGALAPETFDKVLVDAPCSGEGMQYKHNKKVHTWDQKTANQFAKLQLQLLVSGLLALKVGGTLVYSTCTLNPLENEGVIAQLLQGYGDHIELQPVPIDQKSKGFTYFEGKELLSIEQANKLARFRPHIQHTGGFFIAKIKKKSTIPSEISVDRRTFEKNNRDSSSQLQDQVRSFFSKNRAIKRQEDMFFIASNRAVYVSTYDSKQLPKTVFIEKIGIPIIKIGYSGEWVPQQGIATVLGTGAQKNSIEFSSSQVEEFCKQGFLTGDFGKKGNFIIIKWKGKGYALAKQGEGQIKGKI